MKRKLKAFQFSVGKMQWMLFAEVYTTDNTSVDSDTAFEEQGRLPSGRICAALPAQIFKYLYAF